MTRKKEKKEGKVTSARDEQTLGYFKRVDDVIKDDDFDDEEGRKLFIENVFTQIENNEIKLFCDQVISRTLEKLIIYFSDTQIRKVLQNVEDHFCKLTMDKFGSHVLQTLICVIPKTIRSERSKVREVAQEFKDLKGAEQLFLDLCDSFKENLSELVNHIYGSHVVRAAIEVLGGVKVSDNVVRSRASRQSRERDSHSDEKKPFIKLNQGNAKKIVYNVLPYQPMSRLSGWMIKGEGEKPQGWKGRAYNVYSHLVPWSDRSKPDCSIL